MPITVTATITIARPPDVVFAHLTKIDHLVEFEGYGPIPGIARATWERGGDLQLGSIRRVFNTDGSSHREEVVELDPPHRIVDRIFDVDSPLRHLASDVRDRFEVVAVGGGARVDRAFMVEPRNVLARPVIHLLGRTALGPALERHLETVRARLEGADGGARA